MNTINIFYGGNFDSLNVPHTIDLLRASCEVRTLKANLAFGDEFINNCRLNFDMTGSRYLEIEETGYFYEIASYVKISENIFDVALIWDSVLTIGINNIENITGTFKRRTVAKSEDIAFRYVKSSEPVNQTSPFEYTYFSHRPVENGPVFMPFVMTNVDLTEKPSILKYTNPDGAISEYEYPSNKIADYLLYIINKWGGEDTSYEEDLALFFWNEVSRSCYDLNVAFGYSLDVKGGNVPQSEYIEVNENFSGYVNFIRGYQKQVETGLTRSESGNFYHSKTSEMGIFFDLYSVESGENVTVQNFDLSSTDITVGVVPTIDGNFKARFTTYLNDLSGLTGVINSPPFKPLSIASRVNENYMSNLINTTTNVDSLNLSSELQADNAKVSATTSAVSSVASMAMTPTPTSIASGLIGIASTAFNTANTLDNIEQTANNQRENLTLQGTLSSNTPPPLKFGGNFNIHSAMYDFSIRRTSLSNYDREKLDRFFTAFGYNVDGEFLNSPAQLCPREKMSFIMADDVFIYSNTKKYNNFLTSNFAKRMATGLRIWKINPNFDYTKGNDL